MTADYILTTFSPALFGERATVHIRTIALEDARRLVDENTKVVSTRVSHEKLAKTSFPNAGSDVQRYAQLPPGKSALLVSYRGPPVPDTGVVPAGGSITIFLIESDEYQES